MIVSTDAAAKAARFLASAISYEAAIKRGEGPALGQKAVEMALHKACALELESLGFIEQSKSLVRWYN